MSSFFRVAAAALIFLCAEAHPGGVAELDSVLSDCGSVSAFLRSPKHRERYYVALLKWIKVDDKHFPRETYDKILAETARLTKEIPELEERLWSGDGLGKSFAVTIPALAPPEKFSPPEWKKYLSEWREVLATKSRGIVSREDAEKILAEIDGKASAAAAHGERRSRVELARLMASARSRPDHASLEAAAAYLVLDELARGRGGELDAGVVTTVKDVLSSLASQKLSPGAALLARDLLPKTDALRTRVGLAKGEVERQSAREFRFDPLPRRFHGIFKGVKHHECVGGGQGWDKDLTARRFLSVALKGTELHEITERGNHLGFTHHSPIIRSSDRAVFGSAEFISPLFGQSFVIAGDGGARNVPFTELYVAAYGQAMPPAWGGLVKGRSLNIHNAGVLSKIMGSDSFRFSPTVGTETEFEHGDPGLANQIVRQTSVTQRVKDVIGNDMIFDAAVKEAETLRLLQPFDRAELTSVPKMRGVWQKIAVGERPDRLLGWMQFAADSDEIKTFLRERVVEVGKDALSASLARQARDGIITGNRHLDLLPHTPKEIARAIKNASEWVLVHENLGTALQSLFPILVGKKATLNDYGEFLMVVRNTPARGWLVDKVSRLSGMEGGDGLASPALDVWNAAAAKRFAERKPGDAENLLALILTPTAHKGPVAAQQIKFLSDNLENFLHTKPSVAQFHSFLTNAPTVAALVDLRYRTLTLAHQHPEIGPRDAADFLSWLAVEREPTRQYTEALELFFERQARYFATLAPDKDQIFELLRRLPNKSEARIAARDAIMSGHPDRLRPDGFLRLVDWLQEPELVPSPGYTEALRVFADRHSEAFLALRPTPGQVERLAAKCSSRELRRRYIERCPPRDGEALVAMLRDLRDIDRGALAARFVPALDLSPEQAAQVLARVPDGSTKRLLHQMLLRRASDAATLTRLLAISHAAPRLERLRARHRLLEQASIRDAASLDRFLDLVESLQKAEGPISERYATELRELPTWVMSRVTDASPSEAQFRRYLSLIASPDDRLIARHALLDTRRSPAAILEALPVAIVDAADAAGFLLDRLDKFVAGEPSQADLVRYGESAASPALVGERLRHLAAAGYRGARRALARCQFGDLSKRR